MQSNQKIKFGTDGWRGIISDDFTFRNVASVSAAIASYYKLQGKKEKKKNLRIAVGFDTRFLSDRYAQRVAKVIAGYGINVLLSDRAIPTPALSFTIKNRKLTAGVMITASHNPAEYNGIKIKTSEGGAAGVEVTRSIEKLLRKPKVKQREACAKIEKVDFVKDYVDFLRAYVDIKKLRNAGFNVLVDVMHGSGNDFIGHILGDSDIELEFMRNQFNPGFGGVRPEPVLENLSLTAEMMRKERFDLGLVLDGDADRVACFGSGGEFISPQKILGLLILHLSRDKKIPGAVVKTIVGTTLIDKIAKQLKLKLYETPVGFKYISSFMEKDDILIGGEEAGGIGFKGYIPERDGTLAGLLILEMMAYRGKPIMEILKDMEKEFGRYYYLREDLRTHGVKLKIQNLKALKTILGKKVTEIKDYDGIKLVCEDESWLMFRGSGTEPIMRIYAESKNLNRTRQLIEFGKRRLKI